MIDKISQISIQPKMSKSTNSRINFCGKADTFESSKKDSPDKTTFIERCSNSLLSLFKALAPNNLNEGKTAFLTSLDNSASEVEIDKKDAMQQALIEGRYADFMDSDYAKMPLDELEALFDFDEYGFINQHTPETDRVIGKPANIRKNKSTTLNYLRKSDEIEIKTLFTYMQDEQFGTVYKNSAENILQWANHKDGINAGYKKTNDVVHNWILSTLQLELKSAYDALHAPKTGNEKVLIFPNGTKIEMNKFLNAEL